MPTKNQMLQSFIMEEYQKLSLDDFLKDCPAKDKTLIYIEEIQKMREEGIGILISGPNGTGKTFLATEVLKEALDNGYSAQVATVTGIIDIYTKGWESEPNRVFFNERIREIDFLLIDDIGKENDKSISAIGRQVIDRLIRYRSSRLKPTLYTTNATLPELGEKYGKSLMSLIVGNTLKIPVDGKDFRMSAKKQIIEEIFRWII